jgi:hypothetical protein
MAAALALLLALQMPYPWAVESQQNVVRRLHAGPFDGRTTVWLRVIPLANDVGVSPTTFVFVAEFPGREPRARPAVTLWISSDVRFYPLTPRIARLWLRVDDDAPIDFLAPTEHTTLSSSGDDAPVLSGALVGVSAPRLDRMAEARSIAGDVLGVPFHLDQPQRAAIAAFRDSLLPAAPPRRR